MNSHRCNSHLASTNNELTLLKFRSIKILKITFNKSTVKVNTFRHLICKFPITHKLITKKLDGAIYTIPAFDYKIGNI